MAQAFGGEIEGFDVRAGVPQGPQRRQVQRPAAAGLLLVVVVLRVGRFGREQLLRHRRLLVGDDVVRPAPHDRGGRGGAQLLADRRTGEDGTVVLERDAGDLPLPRILTRGPGSGRLAGIGRRSPVRIGHSGCAAAGGEVGQGPPGGAEAVAGLPAAYGLRLADVQAVGGDGDGHVLVVQARVSAATAQDQGGVAADFGEQVPSMEAPAVVHHEDGRGDVDARQRCRPQRRPGPGSPRLRGGRARGGSW
ncbi:hypothetical protein [Streptomyces rubiginosohelvolus]|uniref:hypothetical protein n=1 Tax=Streptomyces rubiginosohelvolus TaxID=67362 RepID=UPI0036B3A5C6